MKLNLKLMSFFVAAATMLSCSNKDDDFLPVEDVVTNKPLDADQTYYVSVVIGDATNGSRSSRADADDGDYNIGNDSFGPGSDPDYQLGIRDENKISSVYLLFYDAEGTRVGNSVLVDQSSAFQSVTASDPTGSVYEIRKGVVQINLSKGETPPSQVVAIINPVSSDWSSPAFQLKMNKLEDIERLQLDYVRSSRGFAMSNSVYYDVEFNNSYSETGGQYSNEKPVSAVALNAEYGLFPTQKAAEEACEKNQFSFDIYVERYAAKVNFAIGSVFSDTNDNANNNVKATLITSVDASTGETEYQEKPVTLVFSPDYWWVNAQEMTTYATKSYFDVDQSNSKIPGDTALSYDQMWAALGVNAKHRNWQWNSKDNHRSYWAQSPAYYAQSYPRVSDDIMDTDNEYDTKDNIHVPSKYSLKYYTYNEIVELNKQEDEVEGKNVYRVATTPGEYAVQYARETTMSSSALNPDAHKNEPNYNYKAALPSVVVTGRYEVRDAPSNAGLSTFYVQGTESNGYYIYNFDNIRNLCIYKSSTFISSTNPSGNNGKITPISVSQYNSYFKIAHPNKATRLSDSSIASTAGNVATASANDELLIDARFVAMQVQDEIKNYNDNIWVLIGDAWKKFDPSDKSQLIALNRLLISNLGLMRMFNTGLAYFNIPIKHLRFNIKSSDSYNYGLEPSDKNYDWSQVRLGDFGVVRNHIYTINVTKIQGLGTGIPDPNTPIVPPVDEEEYYAATRINILNWALVPRQDVEL